MKGKEDMSEKSLLIEILQRVSRIEPTVERLVKVIDGNGKEGLLTTIAKMREVEALLAKSIESLTECVDKHLDECLEDKKARKGDFKWAIVLAVAVIMPLVTKYFL
jgi:hypothetical protein